MKIRLLLALTGLAVGFILPTFAQQKDTLDLPIVQQRDFLGIAVLVTPDGMVFGRQAIEKRYADTFQRWPMTDFLSRREKKKWMSGSGESTWP